VPPVADNPASERVSGRVGFRSGARSAVPLQSGLVEEEPVGADVSIAASTTVAKIDADGLPAGVGDLGVIHVHEPAFC